MKRRLLICCSFEERKSAVAVPEKGSFQPSKVNNYDRVSYSFQMVRMCNNKSYRALDCSRGT